MTREEILRSENSKTRKMQMLFELGLTRREVSELMGVGYGFVQNVYSKTYPERVQTRRVLLETIASAFQFNFNKKFGVEIESFGVSKTELKRALLDAGINTETEGYNHRTTNHWKIVHDGSLSGQDAFELVSPILEGEQGLEELKKVCRVLKAKGARINKTCGLHIHFDARDLELNHWKNLFKNYIKFERVIDSFMPESRQGDNNYYCKSLRKPGAEQKISRAGNLTDLSKKLTNRNRYHKINIEAFWRHSTVEFRQHSGSIEFEKISNWILFLARLVEYSKTTVTSNGTFEGMNEFLNEDLKNYFQTRINKFVA